MRKLLLTIGSISSIVTPIAAVVSCGKTKTTDQTNVGAEDKKLYDRFIFRGKQYKTEAEAKAAVDSETGSMKVYHLKDDSQLFDNKYSALYKYAVDHENEITPMIIKYYPSWRFGETTDLNTVHAAEGLHFYYKAQLKPPSGYKGYYNEKILFKTKEELMANIDKLEMLRSFKEDFDFSSGISDHGIESIHLVKNNANINLFKDYDSYSINNQYLRMKYFKDQPDQPHSSLITNVVQSIQNFQATHPNIRVGTIKAKVGLNGAEPNAHPRYKRFDNFVEGQQYVINGKALTHTQTKLWKKVKHLKAGFYYGDHARYNSDNADLYSIDLFVKQMSGDTKRKDLRYIAKVGSEVIGTKTDGHLYWLSRVGQPLASKEELVNLLTKATIGDHIELFDGYGHSSSYNFYHERDILTQETNGQFIGTDLIDAKNYELYETPSGELTTDVSKAADGVSNGDGVVNTEQLIYPIIATHNDQVIGTITVNSKEYGTKMPTTGFAEPKLDGVIQEIKDRSKLIEDVNNDNYKQWYAYAELCITDKSLATIPASGLQGEAQVMAFGNLIHNNIVYAYKQKCYGYRGDAVLDLIKDIPAEQLVEQADPDNRITVGFSSFINKQDAYDTLIYHAHLPASQLEEE